MKVQDDEGRIFTYLLVDGQTITGRLTDYTSAGNTVVTDSGEYTIPWTAVVWRRTAFSEQEACELAD